MTFTNIVIFKATQTNDLAGRVAGVIEKRAPFSGGEGGTPFARYFNEPPPRTQLLNYSLWITSAIAVEAIGEPAKIKWGCFNLPGDNSATGIKKRQVMK